MNRPIYFFLTILITLAGLVTRPRIEPRQALASTTAAPTATPLPALVLAPQDGQALQGLVTIRGRAAAPGFASAQVDFAYAGSTTGTWFLIRTFDTPVESGPLAAWDTTTITDGMYDLRLVITLQDGSKVTTLVKGLRVRNYSPTETDTPTPELPTATLRPGEGPTTTPTPSRTPTPVPPSLTPLPTNPAVVLPQQIGFSMGEGALAILGFFSLMGIYLLLRRLAARK